MSASFEFIETIVTEIMSYLYSKTLSNIFIYKITICYDIYINDKLSYISCNIVSFTFLFNTLSTIYSDCDTLDVGRPSEITLHLFLLLSSSFTCCVQYIVYNPWTSSSPTLLLLQIWTLTSTYPQETIHMNDRVWSVAINPSLR